MKQIASAYQSNGNTSFEENLMDKLTSQPQKFERLASLVDICAQKGIQNIIISPGSRSAPLTVAFARHPVLQSRAVMDERAAGFIALGLAQQTRRPVALVCTSGTAALNYGPAVTEAFYQQIPLLVFTADRPPEWIDQQDGQTIHQSNLYGPHSRGSFSLPIEDDHPDAQWHSERLISEAVNRTMWPTPGPVQINVPLREPLYPAPDHPIRQPAPQKIIQQIAPEPTLTEETWINLLSSWRQAKQKLVIAGLHPPIDGLAVVLNKLQQDPSVVVVADITANIHDGGIDLHHSDMILGTKSATTLEKLKPDLVVSFGGPVVSKYLKLFLRKHHPQAHWQLQPDGQASDTFQSLTQVIPVNPLYFFETLTARQALYIRLDTPPAASYRQIWHTLESQARALLPTFLRGSTFNEFSVVQQVMQALPANSYLQLGNSMPVRYANFIGLGPDLGPKNIRVNANRGTSGIDGSLSTAVGAALGTERITTLISGDLAFFYDRNGLWHNHVPPNLRIVLLNNRGGGIFKLIDGPSKLPPEQLEAFFFTPQPLSAKNTAADHNCAYFYSNDAETLAQHLPKFFSAESGPAILEIETDSEINARVFQQFKNLLANLKI